MTHISDRKTFYTLALKDRYPIAAIDFPLHSLPRSIRFYSTPLGVIIKSNLGYNSKIHEMKLYDRRRGGFERQKILICDDLVRLEDASLVAMAHTLQIEDVIGRDFLINIDGDTVIARAHLIPRSAFTVDKRAKLVYN